jgi:hypothetical protein
MVDAAVCAAKSARVEKDAAKRPSLWTPLTAAVAQLESRFVAMIYDCLG